mgnify:CR=1 FL=1
MKYLCIITLLFINTITQAQIVDIPDANFKNALINDEVADLGNFFYEDVDTNNDGEIQVSEAEAVIGLNVNYYDISSMEGIEYFINLIILECEDNLLTSLDIAQNINLSGLYCGSNSITELDVTQNINLGFLLCYGNMLTTLDITQNINLIHINFSLNNVAEIDVSQNINLSTLRCRFNNLSEIDVSQNTGLTTLGITGNNISEIDLTQNQEILFFTCGANNFAELDLSQNHNLYWFQCNLNENLEYLDLRNGGNIGLSLMFAHETPNLRCILVDDKAFADSQECGLPTSGWCIDDNDMYVEVMEDCILGIEDNTIINFTIYPNPTQNILFIETQQPIEALKIYNLNGQLIMEDYSKRVDVSNLIVGLYFVQVLIDGKSETKKFVKE